ncbi:MAG: T9SS type A sorting domain-containing protein [Bacteroidota bacterium]|nr:T9SS type A sorting domain-containing protein [Bacteroidota bacterium]
MKNNAMRLFVRLCCAACLVTLVTAATHAQWVKTNGPFGANVWCFAKSGANLFAGTYGAGAFLTTNEGVSWEPVGDGLPGNTINTLTINGSTLYAATSGGLGISTDNGASWKITLRPRNVQTFLIDGNNMFAGTSSGLFVSTDAVNWENIGTDNGLFDTNCVALAVIGTTLFAGAKDDIYRSDDSGTHWQTTGSPYANKLIASGTTLYAATGGGVYISNDNAATWTSINSGAMNNATVWDIAISGKNLFAATDANGVQMSSDNGKSWVSVNDGLPTLAISAVNVDGTTLIAGTIRGVSISKNSGSLWADFNTGLTGIPGHAFAVKGSNLYAASIDKLYKSSDNGRNWISLTDDGGLNSFNNALLVHNSDLFLADAGNGIYRSSDDGMNWESVNQGEPSPNVWGLGELGNVLFVGTWTHYWQNEQRCVYRSLDNGETWQPASSGIEGNGVSYFAKIGGILFSQTERGGSAGDGGVFISADTGTTWMRANFGSFEVHDVISIVTIGTKLYAAATAIPLVDRIIPGGVFVSSDSGATWSEADNGLPGHKGVNLLLSFGNNLLARGDGGFFFSKDGGANWIDANQGLPSTNYTTWGIAQSGSEIILGNDYGIWRRPIAEFGQLSVNAAPRSISDQISISPNPTEGIIMLKGAPENASNVSIMNVLGETMIELHNIKGPEFTIDLSGYTPGIYYVRIVSDHSVMTKKIVKQ